VESSEVDALYIFGRLRASVTGVMLGEKRSSTTKLQRKHHLQLNDQSNNWASFTMRPSQIMRSGGGDAPLGMYGR
jgi:hypothetical protein